VISEATPRLGPALNRIHKRRAVSLPEEAGTNSVTGNFYGVSSYGIDCWPGSAVSLPPSSSRRASLFICRTRTIPHRVRRGGPAVQSLPLDRY